VTVRGERRYLWRAVDQESLPHERSECCGYGDVLDVLVQKRQDKRAAERFFKKLMKGQGRSAREIVTDKLPGYGAARKAIMSTSCVRRSGNFLLDDFPMFVDSYL
jgi:putative transposase